LALRRMFIWSEDHTSEHLSVVNSKGFWCWCITFWIMVFLNFVHCFLFWNNTFQKQDLFLSSVKGQGCTSSARLLARTGSGRATEIIST
jgi:hypothetical protein